MQFRALIMLEKKKTYVDVIFYLDSINVNEDPICCQTMGISVNSNTA